MFQHFFSNLSDSNQKKTQLLLLKSKPEVDCSDATFKVHARSSVILSYLDLDKKWTSICFRD